MMPISRDILMGGGIDDSVVAHSLKTYRDPYSCSWVITLAFLTGVEGKEERCLRTLIVITAINPQLNPSAPCERAVCSRNQRKTGVCAVI